MEDNQKSPEIYVIDKQITCPVCDNEFTARVSRDVRLRLVGTDDDLRPHYEPVDPLHYEVLVCPYCGYAAVTQNFPRMTDKIAARIKAVITPQFEKVSKIYPPMYDAEIAIERFNLALNVNEARSGSPGERGYIYMKLGWLHRELHQAGLEHECIRDALEAFREAYSSERFPICGITEPVMSYIIGEMERRLGHDEEALRWFSRLILDGNEPRLKERARNQKDLILQARAQQAQEVAQSEAAAKAEEEKNVEAVKKKKLFGR